MLIDHCVETNPLIYTIYTHHDYKLYICIISSHLDYHNLALQDVNLPTLAHNELTKQPINDPIFALFSHSKPCIKP